MLVLENLSYRYKTRTAFTLHNISLRLKRGEMLILAGRSGCGKSTLLKAVSGLLRATSEGELNGNVVIDGQNISDLSPEEVGVMVGSVYQTPDDQLFAMTVEDEVGFALENQGFAEEAISSSVSATLQKVGLAGFEKRSIHELSGGQRQRLALASVLVTKPKLLVLDEPVSQMNPQGVKDFMEILCSLNINDGISIIIAEHRVNELAKYFSRLAMMYEGKIVYDGPIEEAWDKIGAKQAVGLREPQNIKLARQLNLSKLESETKSLAGIIESECNIKRGINFCFKERKELAESLLSAKNIAFTYPGAKKATLHDISFDIYPGQTVALMGYNGAGKSTLMNILAGLTKPSAGELNFLHEAVITNAHLIGYLRQEPDLMLLADSVLEELNWKNKYADEKYINTIIDKMSLREYINDFPLALSKGQRLRTVLGALLARKPKLLLLDEPTAGQDQQSLDEIKELISFFVADGGSVLFCTHDIELAGEIADRVILMSEGKFLVDDAAGRVLSNTEKLLEGGLNEPPMLKMSKELLIPSCITVEEVKQYVDASVVGRQ
ncbi:MAG: energy-coupling factor ABC transporter ATP-binding protein [Negativicutes bacterium]|nr:energy-coupling factor ABC transporter ATP-binding protein [Negativicutes bacterium]